MRKFLRKYGITLEDIVIPESPFSKKEMGDREWEVDSVSLMPTRTILRLYLQRRHLIYSIKKEKITFWNVMIIPYTGIGILLMYKGNWGAISMAFLGIIKIVSFLQRHRSNRKIEARNLLEWLFHNENLTPTRDILFDRIKKKFGVEWENPYGDGRIPVKDPTSVVWRLKS